MKTKSTAVNYVRTGLLNLSKLESRFEKKLFLLCDFSVKRMFWLFFGVLLLEQFASHSLELLIWGEKFVHALDPIFSFLILGQFVRYANRMGEFLLSEATERRGPVLIIDNDHK
ncbi:hypothetical protein VCRA2110O2_30134 [Vibrio crassostreae]|nr:hypothetical protein VCHA44O286_50241 [Vibrio chagasii]CAK2852920.1 hypothetical protein VCRA2110O2_30134 [Vibrio crassostreae]